MPLRDQFYAVLVAFIWGIAFIPVKWGVAELPPLMLTAARFFFTAFPAIFFIAPPRAKVSVVIAYGLVLGVGQFGFVFTAMAMGISVGLTSIVVQTQVFFTIILTVIVFRERPLAHQIAGSLIAFAGVVLVGQNKLGDVIFVPFLMVIAAAFCWGSANVIGKTAGTHRHAVIRRLVQPGIAGATGSVVAADRRAGRDRRAVAAILDDHGGLSWSWHGRRPCSVSACGAICSAAIRRPALPLSPCSCRWSGLIAGAIFLGERIGVIELVGGSLVMAGLACVLFWPRLPGPWHERPEIAQCTISAGSATIWTPFDEGRRRSRACSTGR